MEPTNTEIRIAGYLAASLLLEREPKQWHALVLLDSGKEASDFIQEHTVSHLCLRFDDIEEPRVNKLTPTRSQIAQALEFAKGKDKLLVSCRAGRGRSVALAYIICCRTRGISEALNLLDPTRHRPNRLVVSLGDTLLDAPCALDSFDDWRRRHAHVQLSEYYDEMEKEFETLEAQGATNRICGP
ncbi:Dual specificity phosphatase, catalytic domain [Gemmata sp. SH-PL17]|uniref:dual specificity protein phosphatase family protein n=1 Tax=Gemmata sp. SH-PL17 TaxID=1630693 RepID=UPI00078E8FAB|nr:dual specificity protein phosphatase family protein [Gemmata sp. SH-PL17]AMV25765.1 Dual specificity phosphatase, catalytic domain [Gemmata sp. SH-PL17]